MYWRVILNLTFQRDFALTLLPHYAESVKIQYLYVKTSLQRLVLVVGTARPEDTFNLDHIWK